MNKKLIKQNSKSAFTIVELLIVIVVIGILAGIVVVSYNGVQDKARTQAAQVLAKEIRDKAEIFYVETGRYPLVSELKDPKHVDGRVIKSARLSQKALDQIVAGSTLYVGGHLSTKYDNNKSKIAVNFCRKGMTWLTGNPGTETHRELEGLFVYYYDYAKKKPTKDPLMAGYCNDKLKDNKVYFK